MLIKERILSLFIFTIILFIVFFSIINCKNKNKINIILKLYILILGTMGFFYEPLKGKTGGIEGGADLNRIFYFLDTYSFNTLKDLYEAIKNTTTPGTQIYYGLISKMSNKHFLPAITALIIFSFCFGIIIEILKRDKEVRPMEVGVAILLFMSRGLFLQSISNIRTLLGLSIISWCNYQEFYSKKKIGYLLPYYIIASSFHSMVQGLFLYRIVYFLFQKIKKKKERKRIILFLIPIAVIFYYFGIKYISKILMKAEYYISSAREGTAYFYIWEYILSIISILITAYLIRILVKSDKIKSLKNERDKYDVMTKEYISYIKPLLYLNIAYSVIEYSFFQRLSWYLSILCIPLTIYAFKNRRIIIKSNKILRNNILIITLFMLVISCVRGDLCGLNFFEKI